jgi:hypothetical protein
MKQEYDVKLFVDKSSGVGVGGVLLFGKLAVHENRQ